MIKLTTDDTEYLMSYVQPDENSAYQVRLLAMFTNGFLTSDGFYKEVWAPNRPNRDIVKPTVFNAVAALDLPIDFREYKAYKCNDRKDIMAHINKPATDMKIGFIDMGRAFVYAQNITSRCPDNTEGDVHFNVYDYEYSWVLLYPQK